MIERVPGSLHDHFTDEELENYDPADDWHTFDLWLPGVTDPNAHMAAITAALDAAGLGWKVNYSA